TRARRAGPTRALTTRAGTVRRGKTRGRGGRGGATPAPGTPGRAGGRGATPAPGTPGRAGAARAAPPPGAPGRGAAAGGGGRGGRPGVISADAYAQVSLALTMSHAGAEWWTNLAVDLQWRLATTGAALRAGVIDLARAKAIADATAQLDDDKARLVEAKV